jgi:small subunit ribosomal protein S17
MANNRRRLVGRVVSDKMDKTRVIAVDVAKRHRLYDKVVRLTRKYYAHDELNASHLGDVVQIVESKPMSRTKRWALETIVQKKQ